MRHWSAATLYFSTSFLWWLLLRCVEKCGWKVLGFFFNKQTSKFFSCASVRVLVYVGCANVQAQARVRAPRRAFSPGTPAKPRTGWAAIIERQLASQGRTRQVEPKSPLIRDSQVPLEWSAQQPITLLSWPARSWLFYCKSYPAKGGRLQALSGWIFGADVVALARKTRQLQRVDFRNFFLFLASTEMSRIDQHLQAQYVTFKGIYWYKKCICMFLVWWR